jgi:hypothetical protein
VRRHAYGTQREKRTDLWVAFAAWFVVNIAGVVLIQVLSSSHPTRGFILSTGWILVNLAAPIVLAFTRTYAALGILLAFATGFWLVVVEGVFFTISDFVAPSGTTSVSGGQYGFLAAGLVVGVVGAFLVLRAINRSIK